VVILVVVKEDISVVGEGLLLMQKVLGGEGGQYQEEKKRFSKEGLKE